MKFILSVLLVACVLGLTYSASVGDSVSQGRIDLVKGALERMICYDDYWEGTIFEPGSHISLEIRFNREKFHVVVCGPLDAGPGLGYVFYTGRIKEGEAAIADMMAYTTGDVTGKDMGGPAFESERKRIETWDLHKDYMLMPIDCTPRYDASTSKKELMIQTIVNEVRHIYSDDNRPGHEVSRVPELTLIIADFNIDYRNTEVIVEPFGKVLRLALHDPQNYDREDYEAGGYTWVEIYGPSHDAVKAIREHGIVKKIRRTPE
jgi:hypothetical protein